MFNTNLKNALCRTCLSPIRDENNFNIFDTEDLAKKIILCSSLPVETTDGYPIHVCLECYKQIQKFHEFQQMCCQSLEKFNKLVKTDEIESNRNSDLMNEKSGLESTTEVCKSSYTENIIEVYIEKKKRTRPSKKKRKTYKNERLSQSESQRNPLECENMEYESLNSKLNQVIDLKTYKNHKPSCGENNELDLSSYSGLEEKTFSETDSQISSQELKTVQYHSHYCDRCDKSFNVAESLEAHKREHDGTPPYICAYEGCSRSFNRWHFFNKHQKEHIAKKEHTYKCDVESCERVYKNRCALNIHKRKYHNIGPELKKHMCEICGKVFKSATVLSDHRYTHIDRTQLPYACEEEGCFKRFSTKEKLRVHKMRHAGIKNFICPYCGMRKTTRNELKIHINYHTLERTWQCRFCPKVCNNAGNLKMHVKNIHERAKDFVCRFCERTFAKADTRKYHEMTHTGEKPHECEQCGRKFVQPAALRTHRKIHLRQKMDLREERRNNEVVVKDQMQTTIEVVESTVITEAIVAEALSDNNLNLEQ